MRKIAIGIMIAMLCLASAKAGDDGYGNLDFRRLSKEEEDQFFERVSSLAFDEAVLNHCGRSDNFEQRAKDAIRACVTKDALDRAAGVFEAKVKSTTNYFDSAGQCYEPTVARPTIGVNIQTTPKGEISKGAVVASVIPTFPAEVAGIKGGDTIVSINGDPVADIDELHERLAALSASTAVKVGVLRQGKQLFFSTRLLTFYFSPNGHLVIDWMKGIKSSQEHLGQTLKQITELCQYCKYSIFRMYCN